MIKYISQYGHQEGHPILWLHGGPGACCTGEESKYFNLDIYRLILLDQLGSGKSIPFGNLQENNTPNLVQDLEILRSHLKIKKWSIVGGSWGSLLALCYSIKYFFKSLNFIINFKIK